MNGKQQFGSYYHIKKMRYWTCCDQSIYFWQKTKQKTNFWLTWKSAPQILNVRLIEIGAEVDHLIKSFCCILLQSTWTLHLDGLASPWAQGIRTLDKTLELKPKRVRVRVRQTRGSSWRKYIEDILPQLWLWCLQHHKHTCSVSAGGTWEQSISPVTQIKTSYRNRSPV